MPGAIATGTRTTDMKDLKQLSEQFDIPVTIVTLPADAGYGTIQKIAFGWAIEERFDIAAVVHASGYFPLSALDRIVLPVVQAESGAVLARRARNGGAKLTGGIAWWKVAGNRYLCSILNRIVGHTAHEWLCPFRAYSMAVLRSMPFQNNSDDHVFDLEMLVGCMELDDQLDEVEVPVAPDAAFSLSDCIRLAKDSLIAVSRYRFHKMGFGTGSTAFNSLAYEVKLEENSSHDGLLRWLERIPTGPGARHRVLRRPLRPASRTCRSQRDRRRHTGLTWHRRSDLSLRDGQPRRRVVAAFRRRVL